MDFPSIIAAIGGFALIIGIFGGGIQVKKDITIPKIHAFPRVILSVVGLILILTSVITFKPELLSLIPEQSSGPVNIVTYDPTKPLLFDNFDNDAYQGKYDTDLWFCKNCAFADGLVAQTDKSVQLKGDKSHRGGLLSQASWFSTQISYAEVRMKLESTDNGEINPAFHTTLDSSSPWFADCSIEAGQADPGKAVFNCSVYTYVNGQYISEYGTEATAVNFDEWHTARIEITHPALELRFYLDGKLIGEHIPVDADELKKKVFGFGLGITTDTNLVGYYDDVVVQPVK